jgi:hypothetical protein
MVAKGKESEPKPHHFSFPEPEPHQQDAALQYCIKEKKTQFFPLFRIWPDHDCADGSPLHHHSDALLSARDVQDV